jgi:hypothetical protein
MDKEVSQASRRPPAFVLAGSRAGHASQGVTHPPVPICTDRGSRYSSALREEKCPYLEWQYDEVELINTGRAQEFRHSIHFTNGLERRLRFKDFDFATLKPVERMPVLAEAEH